MMYIAAGGREKRKKLAGIMMRYQDDFAGMKRYWGPSL